MSSFPLSRLRRRPFRAAFAVAAVGSALALPTAARAESPTVDGREGSVIERVNAIRADHGLAPLTVDPSLSRAADRHSRRMARAHLLAHRVWDESDLAARLRWATGDARVGETIFWGSGTARSAEIVRAWMTSPGHRDLLLSDGFHSAGIGIRTGGGGVYATVDLASS